jgi:hypothetical protein
MSAFQWACSATHVDGKGVALGEPVSCAAVAALHRISTL